MQDLTKKRKLTMDDIIEAARKDVAKHPDQTPRVRVNEDAYQQLRRDGIPAVNIIFEIED